MSEPPPASAGDLVGRLLNGRYQVTRFIAGGGMAQVWEADDTILARKVAVKILRPGLAADAQFVARFRAEAVSAARLSHPAIVSIYDTWTDDGLEAIVMELVQGITLRSLLDQKGRLDVSDALAIAGHVTDALSAAHQAGLVHRDVKPANVLLSDDGRVLVTDFGIAKATESADITTESVMLGTAKYLAPEQVEGARVDARSDIYALGVVLYEMLCGRPPFQGDTDTATALARLRLDPTPPTVLRPELSPAVVDVLTRSLARRPDDRFASAAEMQRAIIRARRTEIGDHGRAQGSTAGAAPPAPHAPLPVAAPVPHPSEAASGGVGHRTAPPSRAGRRRPVVPVALGLLVVMALGVAGILVTDAGNDEGGIGDIRERVEQAIPGGDEGEDPVAAPRIVNAAAWDPMGDPPGDEYNERAPLAVDGDPATAWQTEGYNDPAIGTKPGVGIYLELESPTELGNLAVTSTSTGWAAEVYVMDGPPSDDPAGWGERLDRKEGIPAGTTTFDLQGRTGSTVLLWMTHMGGDGRVEIPEITVEAPA